MTGAIPIPGMDDMPDAADAPASPAVDLPPAIDVDSIDVLAPVE